MPDECVFCKIVAKQVPSFGVYEDENFMAFLDIHPNAKGHTLVIPKAHSQWTWEVPQFGDYFEVAKTIALAAMKSLDSKWVNFLTAGLGVPHSHIHIIPRFENDGQPEFPTMHGGNTPPENELIEIAAKIRDAVPEFLPKKEEPVVEETVEEVKEPERSEEDIAWLKRQAGLE